MTYLRLFHGRKDPNQDMDDWGEDGPCFKIEYAHVTYMGSIKINVDGEDGELYTVGDLVYYDDMYYGDWSVFHDGALQYPIIGFDQELANLPPKGPSITLKEAITLIKCLKKEIEDEYRASEEDTRPSMLLTVGDDGESWSYQTGDNSFTGGAYGYPHWAVVSIYRNSNSKQLATDIVNQLEDLFA